MPLNVFYTMVQKSQKWPKTQIKGGPALRWLLRNAQRSEQWCPNGEGASRRVPDTSVRGSRSYHQTSLFT